MKNRLVAILTGMVVFGLTGTVFAQQNRQTIYADDPISATDDTTVKLSGETDLYKEEEGPSPLDRMVSIRVSQVPISSFLNSLATQAKINFVMGDEFTRIKVTASLTKVTVRDALDTVLRINGLTYQRIGKSDSYVVTKRSNDAPDTITKIYTLSYISLKGIGSASSELSSVMPQDVSSKSGSDDSGAGDSGSGGASSSGGGGVPGGAAEITGIIKSMLSPAGRIAVDARTNKLIITDIPEVFPQIENILAELDIKPPQILIEAQIVEVSKTSGLNLGFQYGGAAGNILTMASPQRVVDLNYVKGVGVSGWGYIFPSTDQSNAAANQGSGNGTSSGEGDSSDRTGLLDFGAFNIVLNSMLTRGEAKYLGKPKVVTLNNQTATITTSTDATVGMTTDITGSSGGTTMVTTTAERKRVGLILEVTPQVNREGYVTLFVKPSYSDLVSSGFDNTKDTTARAATTLVRVKNGQTVVIGGLLTSRETEQIRKVPFLGDIPILGWLFTNKVSSKSTTDLVIFITPTVLAE